ncbi:2-oxo-4-hydroxy-4-carboxy-5-ureidoimidazoline decarboxylase [Streptomyces sp. NPDC050145]|uniref:2-oxo-4-hydroxy-4-carboxy-5-ureidoimidazoline decarboxylase n=1 Tax=Streptomyces sp. NPDC050145 TaxID=3365602 RepID=UPI0037B5AF75
MTTVTTQNSPNSVPHSRRRHPLSAAHDADPGRLPIPAQATPRGGHSGLTPFNALPQSHAEAALMRCCGSLAWAHRLAAHRPYPDLDALLAAADEAAYDLTPADITQALAREEPARPPDPAGYSAAHTALAAAHAAYEARFGHPFVLFLDATAPGEALDHLLSALRDRMGREPDEERSLAAEELRRLARGRITRLVRNLPVTRTAAPGAIRPERSGNSPYVPV